MAKKEFLKLMENNILLLDKLGDKLKKDPVSFFGYPRQQISVLVRLYLGGKAMLKDIARREFVTAPNLCAAFRKLEKDGLVSRTIDEKDRRNTWYSVTDKGKKIAQDAVEMFRGAIEKLFDQLSKEDENKLTEALKTINNILMKMELSNA